MDPVVFTAHPIHGILHGDRHVTSANTLDTSTHSTIIKKEFPTSSSDFGELADANGFIDMHVPPSDDRPGMPMELKYTGQQDDLSELI